MKSEYINIRGTTTRNLVKYAYDTYDEVAMAELGFRYLAGRKVRKNVRKADYWFGLAAGEGSGYACYMLGQMAECNVGQFKGDDAAFYWYAMGAGLEDNECLNQLGIMYASGISVEVDEGRALELFAKAKEVGNEVAEENIRTIKEKIDRPFFGINAYD